MATDGWLQTCLGDLIDIKHGYAFEGQYFRDDPPGDVLLTPGNFAVGGGFQVGKVKYYEGPVPEEYVLQVGDLLVTMTDLSMNVDTLGYPAFVPPATGFRYLHNQRLGKVMLRPGAPVEYGYLYYLLQTDEYRAEILASATGTTVRHTSPSRIKQFAFLLPPLDEQRSIARILGALDDKIELNRRMNETLEGMARALFQSWFVDFDPVRAKAEGRQPAWMDAETAALFSDGFEESALGLIPRGWRVSAFSDTVTLSGGGTPKTTIPEYWGGDVPWFSVVDAPCDSDVFVIETEKHITQAGLVNSSTRVLQPGASIISARGTVGRCAIVGVPMAMNQSCYGVHASNGRGDYYTYFSLRRSVADLQRSSHGSVFDTITRDTFERVSIVTPPVEITVRFEAAVCNLMEQILLHLQESRTLAATRDALLPKLLSGEVRAGEAERVVREGIHVSGGH